jgi:hypothetical protein
MRLSAIEPGLFVGSTQRHAAFARADYDRKPG